MNHLLNILIVFTFYSCTENSQSGTNDCKENQYFKKRYYECIIEIEQYQKREASHEQVTDEEGVNLMKNINTLTRITGLKPHIVTDYRFGYPDSTSFELDKQQWEKWYEENKCSNLEWVKYAKD